ncbi:MAG: glycosyltransferase, partial [Treponema sp.]|uniref:glycosyltransferase n=1 Tax=Treponema sp. TaxID=166 RepID=UPI00298E735E
QHPKKSREEIRKEFGFAEGDFIVGHVGRFVDQKNHNFLIDIFVEILKLRKNAKLLLVGEGPLQDTIKEKCKPLKIEDKVFFTGVRTDVPEIMSGMDVFLFPSKFEGLSVSLIEAQIVVPFVVTSDAVSFDTSVSGNICFISLKKSAEVWAKICCFKNTDFVKPVNNIADFDIKTVISRLESFYAE